MSVLGQVSCRKTSIIEPNDAKANIGKLLIKKITCYHTITEVAYVSLVERHYIEFQLKKGIKPKEISKSLGRDPRTIYREIKRNNGLSEHRHNQANNFAIARHNEKNKNMSGI